MYVMYPFPTLTNVNVLSPLRFVFVFLHFPFYCLPVNHPGTTPPANSDKNCVQYSNPVRVNLVFNSLTPYHFIRIYSKDICNP